MGKGICRFFVFLILSGPLLAVALEEQAPIREFSPEFFEHDNPGCPSNSICTKSMGRYFKRWNEMIKGLLKLPQKQQIKKIEKFRQSSGLPISILTKKENSTSLPGAFWQSPCPSHRKLSSPLMNADLFLRHGPPQKIDPLPKSKKTTQKGLYLQEFITESQGIIKRFWGPMGELPSYYQGQKMILLRESEGIFYQLAINKSGTWKVEPYRPQKVERSKIKCPKKLAEIFLATKANHQIYKGYACRRIENLKTKEVTLELSGRTCQ